MTRPQQFFALTLVLLFATLLRTADLGRESLWHDEAHSALQARTSLIEIAHASATTDNNPPIYYQLLHGWALLFGEDEAALRSLSVVFGIGGIAASYALARALGGSVLSLWVALLMATSLFHVLYSREARMYSMLSCFATLSMYAFVKLPGRHRSIDLLYVASSVGTFYAHTVGLFVLLAHQLCWAATRWSPIAAPSTKPGRWLRLQIAVAVCVAPWLYISSQQLSRLGGVFWLPPPTAGSIVDVLIEMAGSPQLFFFAVALALAGSAAMLGAAPSASAKAADTELPPLVAFTVLTIWTIVPIALPWLLSRVVVPIFMSRVAMASLAPLTILVARGIISIRPRAVGTAVGLLLAALSTVNTVRWEQCTTKENWRDLTHYVEGAAEPGDLILFHQTSRRQGFRYYSHRQDLPLAGFPPRRFRAGESVQPEELGALDAIVQDHGRVWLILSDSKDDARLIPSHLARTYRIGREQRFYGLSAQLFEQ